MANLKREMKIFNKEIQTDHKNAINWVFKFIDKNLESDMSLKIVSEIAFSHHFIFIGFLNLFRERP